MTRSLPDLQSDADTRGVPIDEVGIGNLRHPIVVLDRGLAKQQTTATISMSVDVAAEARGAHLSRFLEVLDETGGELTVNTAPTILARLRARLEANSANLQVSFPYFVERRAPVSGARGLLDVECRFAFVATGDDLCELLLEVTTPVTTLCPCSKAISDYGAHNQRSNVTLTVLTRPLDRESPTDGIVWIEDLVEIAEGAASCPVYPTLKRADERFVTMKAFDHPAFVEDVARDAAVVLQNDGRVLDFAVRVVSEESIHNHTAFARIGNLRI